MKYIFNSESFSKAIRTERILNREMKLSEVSVESGVSVSTISRCERRMVVDIETFLKICDWLECSPMKFIQIKK